MMKEKLYAVKVEVMNPNVSTLFYKTFYTIVPLKDWHDCVKVYEPEWFEEKYTVYLPYEIKEKYQNKDVKKLLDKFYKNSDKFIKKYCKKED